ncbi:hypothetical protein BDN71DRAFT_1170822 [Pleurotus eryngii]|uniref:Uncharacterized protein n=1 Tax=Pleurotus eryngii TaxID=5323 RepID=A0A9P5ZU42_PLEER|nr:hypothetical protein BDN71DRAFT_1170822 [Pleurotus eryngii]
MGTDTGRPRQAVRPGRKRTFWTQNRPKFLREKRTLGGIGGGCLFSFSDARHIRRLEGSSTATVSPTTGNVGNAAIVADTLRDKRRAGLFLAAKVPQINDSPLRESPASCRYE